MPTYTCTAAKGLLNQGQKARIAEAITAAHADITGAPAYFAQVFFQEIAEGDHFIGGRPLNHEHVFVYGHIRDGRAADDRKALIRKMTADLAEIVELPTFSIWVYLAELPAASMVEFGHILPEAGDEPIWNDALPVEDRERMQAISK